MTSAVWRLVTVLLAIGLIGGPGPALAQSVTYVHDAADRLVEVRYPTRVVRYVYDAAGNRLLHEVVLPIPPPTVTGLSPAAGPVAGGSLITVGGTGFIAGQTRVTVGGIDAASVTVTSPTTLAAITPLGQVGPADVVVTTSIGGASLAQGFLYVAPPVILSVAPANGSIAGGTALVVSGMHFVPGQTGVTVGGVAATMTATSDVAVSATTPAGALGPTDLVVTTPGGSVTLAGGFTYVPAPPTVTAIAPASGGTAGGTAITVTGSGFDHEPVTVTVGGASATAVSVVNASTVTAVTPAGSAGAAAVKVSTAFGEATLAGGFVYVEPSAFTDDPPVAGVTIVRAAHLVELRQRVDTLRLRFGLAPIIWTDATLTSGQTMVKAMHLLELRSAVNEVYVAAGRTPPSYTTPAVVAGQTVIRAADVAELRAAVVAIW